MNWLWPLPLTDKNLPGQDTQGYFGAVRKYDIHTGVDLYCEKDAPVRAVESGIVQNIEVFTGPRAGSPWWNETYAVWIEGDSGMVVYGEIKPTVRLGDDIKIGDRIGTVETVLSKDKGLSMNMLHLELYSPEMTETVWWEHGQDKPEHLLDPTEKLQWSVDKEEFVLCAAVWYPDEKFTPHHRPLNIDKGIVFSGQRHPHCIGQAVAMLYPNWNKALDTFDPKHDEMRIHCNRIKIEGFLTSINRFVDRKEGAVIALENGQISKLNYSSKEMYSEDLY